MANAIHNNQGQPVEWSNSRKWLAATGIIVALTSAVAFAVLMGLDNGCLRPAFKPWAISGVGLSTIGITLVAMTLINPLWSPKQKGEAGEKPNDDEAAPAPQPAPLAAPAPQPEAPPPAEDKARKLKLEVTTHWKKVAKRNKELRQKYTTKWKAVVAERKAERNAAEKQNALATKYASLWKRAVADNKAKRAEAESKAEEARRAGEERVEAERKAKEATWMERVKKAAEEDGVLGAGAAGVQQFVNDVTGQNGWTGFLFSGVRAPLTVAHHYWYGKPES
jgi:hypothetical protein